MGTSFSPLQNDVIFNAKLTGSQRVAAGIRGIFGGIDKQSLKTAKLQADLQVKSIRQINLLQQSSDNATKQGKREILSLVKKIRGENRLNQAQLRRTKQELSAIRKLTFGWAQAFRRVQFAAGILAGIIAFKILRGIKNAVTASINLNKEFESMQVGVAATLSANTKIITAQGQQLTGVTAIVAAQLQSKSIMRDILNITLQTGGTTDVTLKAFRIALPLFLQQKATLQDTLEVVKRLNLAAIAIGIPVDLVQLQIDDIARGVITARTTLARVLGITQDQLRVARQNNKIVDLVKEKTQAFIAAQDILLGKFAAAQNRLKALAQIIGIEITEKAFGKLRDAMNSIIKQVAIFGDEGEFLGFTPKTQEAVDRLKKSLERIATSLTKFATSGAALGVFENVLNSIANVIDAVDAASKRSTLENSRVFLGKLIKGIITSATGSLTEPILGINPAQELFDAFDRNVAAVSAAERRDDLAPALANLGILTPEQINVAANAASKRILAFFKSIREVDANAEPLKSAQLFEDLAKFVDGLNPKVREIAREITIAFQSTQADSEQARNRLAKLVKTFDRLSSTASKVREKEIIRSSSIDTLRTKLAGVTSDLALIHILTDNTVVDKSSLQSLERMNGLLQSQVDLTALRRLILQSIKSLTDAEESSGRKLLASKKAGLRESKALLQKELEERKRIFKLQESNAERLIKLQERDEFKSINKIFALRLENAVKLGKKQAELQEIQLERDIRLAEASQQRFNSLVDSISTSAGAIFDALLTKGQSVFSSIQNFARGIFETIFRTIFQRLAQQFAKSIVGSLRAALEGRDGILGSIKDALFGKSPQITAIKANSDRLGDNSDEIRNLTERIVQLTNQIAGNSAGEGTVGGRNLIDSIKEFDFTGGGVGGSPASGIARGVASGIANIINNRNTTSGVVSGGGGLLSSLIPSGGSGGTLGQAFNVFGPESGFGSQSERNFSAGMSAGGGKQSKTFGAGNLFGAALGGLQVVFGKTTGQKVAGGLQAIAALDPEPISRFILTAASLLTGLFGSASKREAKRAANVAFALGSPGSKFTATGRENFSLGNASTITDIFNTSIIPLAGGRFSSTSNEPSAIQSIAAGGGGGGGGGGGNRVNVNLRIDALDARSILDRAPEIVGMLEGPINAAVTKNTFSGGRFPSRISEIANPV